MTSRRAHQLRLMLLALNPQTEQLATRLEGVCNNRGLSQDKPKSTKERTHD